MILIHSCPNCNSKELRPHSMKVEPGSLHISRTKCSNCGLITANPMASREEIVSFYQSYYDKGNFELFKYKDLHRTNFEKYEHLSSSEVNNMFKYVLDFKQSGNFLDVGFGLGEPLFIANKLEFNIYGTEYDRDAINFIKEYIPKGNFYEGDLLEANYPDNHFDFVRFWHVIEHVLDPKSYLNEIHRILKPGGVLMLGTPNIGCFGYLVHRFIRFHLHKIPKILDGTDHTFLFNKNLLRDYVRNSQYKVISQFSHGRKENLITLFSEDLPFKKKLVRLIQSYWDVDQTLYALKDEH